MNTVLLFLVAYGAMLPMVAVHVLVNWKVLGYAGYTSLQQLKAEGPRVEAYRRTLPFQPLYNLLVFGVISLFFLPAGSVGSLLLIGFQWLVLAAVTDALTWVLIPHPWRLTWRELYIGHQPWITICYLLVLLTPLLRLVSE